MTTGRAERPYGSWRVPRLYVAAYLSLMVLAMLGSLGTLAALLRGHIVAGVMGLLSTALVYGAARWTAKEADARAV